MTSSVRTHDVWFVHLSQLSQLVGLYCAIVNAHMPTDALVLEARFESVKKAPSRWSRRGVRVPDAVVVMHI